MSSLSRLFCSALPFPRLRALSFKFFPAWVVALLLGCSAPFVRLSDDQFALGQDTSAKIKQELGEGYNLDSFVQDDNEFKTMSYLSTSFGGQVRGQVFYFKDDVLVGHAFRSSHDADSTDFDESKLSSIEKGKTTITEIIDLIGEPSGEVIFPLVKIPIEKEKVYSYLYLDSPIDLDPYWKILRVTYNEDYVVTGLDYYERGDSPD